MSSTLNNIIIILFAIKHTYWRFQAEMNSSGDITNVAAQQHQQEPHEQEINPKGGHWWGWWWCRGGCHHVYVERSVGVLNVVS